MALSSVNQLVAGRTRHAAVLPLVATLLCTTGGCVGCLFLDSGGEFFEVRGRVWDATTSEPLQAIVLVRAVMAGEPAGVTSQATLFGEDPPPGLSRPAQPGDFVVAVGDGAFGPACAGPFGPRLPPPEFPLPDQIEFVVQRGTCEFTFLLDVNDVNFVDPTAPDDLLELREPILVPPCPE